jgi:hypothetical protein
MKIPNIPTKILGMLVVFFVTLFSGTAAFAVAGGVPDNGAHPAAGYLVYNRIMESSCGNYVNKCSGALIDITNLGIPATYTRRLFLTAAHCLGDQDAIYIADGPTGATIANIYVAFEQTPIWSDCAATGRTKSVDGSLSIGINGREEFNPLIFTKVIKAYFPVEIHKNSGTVGSKTGQLDWDYSIFVLETAVPESIVPNSALFKLNIPGLPSFIDVKRPEDIPGAQVTTTGYGRAYSGLDGNGKPIYSGPTFKMTIMSPVDSVQNNGFHTQMYIQQDQGSLCLWDSGSAGIVDGSNIIMGVTAGGDANCRSINTYSRVDTPAFYDWLFTRVRPLLTP